MSNLLERAIIDAKALKEAALKNAEQLVIEKYSKEVKELSIQTYAFFVVFPFLIAAHPVTFQDLHRSPSIRLRHVKTVLFLKDYLAF